MEERKPLKIEKTVAKQREMNASNLAVSLNSAVNQYKQLKRIFLGLEAKLLLCDALGEPDSLHQESIDAELAVAVKEAREAKSEVEECKGRIETLADQIQTMLEAYEEKCKELKDLHHTVMEKKKKLDEEAECLGSSQQDEKHTEILNRVSQEITKMEEMQAKWKTEISSLREENVKLAKSVAEVEARRENEKNLHQEDEGLQTLYDELCAVSGVREIGHSGDALTLSLYCQGGDELSTDLTLRFTVADDGLHTLNTAQLSAEGVDIADIVDHHKKENNLPGLVTRVRERWLRSHRIAAEVASLRDRFALDWRCSEGVIQVLYGTTVCSLGVTPAYPRPGGITLLKVSGKEVKEIQPGPEVVTLTQWLQYLHDLLH